MNPLFLIFIVVPIMEIFFMIKIGAEIGALNTILLIFLTAIVGLYYAKLEGIRTLKSGIQNLYKDNVPIYEIVSGASIAFAALMLILPGFITDALGFLILIPFTRNIFINFFLKIKKNKKKNNVNDVVDGEIIEDKKDEL